MLYGIQLTQMILNISIIWCGHAETANSVKVWSQDAMLRDVSSFYVRERNCTRLLRYLSKQAVESLIQYLVRLSVPGRQQDLAKLIEQHINTFVRKGSMPHNLRSRKKTVAVDQ